MGHSVVVVGGGPTGLMLAGELALGGVDVLVLERDPAPETQRVRSRGIHSRSIEVLHQRGLASRFLDQGQPFHQTAFLGATLDLSDLPSRFNFTLAIPQPQVESLLRDWLQELGVPTLRGRGVAALAQDPSGVTLTLSDASTLRAAYVVGCDGGRSTIRKAAGIPFPGLDPTVSWVMAELALEGEPPLGMRPEGGAIAPAGPLYQVVFVEPTLREGEPTLRDVEEALLASCGSSYAAHAPSWISRFTNATRQAATYREGRVLLAGDAAHTHPPLGGQGLNLGLQDAVNLGWKLARVAQGSASAALLDTYSSERHPVAARVLRNTLAQSALGSADPATQALKEVLAGILSLDEPRRCLAAAVTGLDTRYDLGSHPLTGWRMPDLDLPEGSVYSHLHAARGLLLSYTSLLDERVPSLPLPSSPWTLPLLGEVDPPPAVLVRPDGHIAWAGDPLDPSLAASLETWFGPR